MISRQRASTEIHWEYFLGLEEDLIRACRFVDLVESQRGVYSQFFTQLFITACTEFEAVCKAVGSRVGKDKIGGISDIRDLLKPIESAIVSCKLSVLRGDLEVRPFASWEENQRLSWWSDYGSIKHARHTKLELGSLGNAVYSMGALFIANMVLGNSSGEYPLMRPSSMFHLAVEGDGHPLFRQHPHWYTALTLHDANYDPESDPTI